MFYLNRGKLISIAPTFLHVQCVTQIAVMIVGRSVWYLGCAGLAMVAGVDLWFLFSTAMWAVALCNLMVIIFTALA